MGQAMREFLAEVETIGSIHHFNLVRLIGFSAEKSSCLLVYEYMINSGRRNLDRSRSESSKHLLSLLQKKAEEDQLLEIVETLDDDEEVRDHREEMVRLIRIAAWCLQNDHTRRPLMSTVVKVLEGVMEVDPNINYKFTHAMGSSSVADHLVSSAPQASVLSNPR
ncbi:hypothetical protein TEA_009067 [Camellia sinensis var. sinensis]|uniref:Protein kinase domain-containing protein n=1 Tax=Camellia sinensis var. sinensis TaxID=542762 RepID=A0A4S4DK46_CAMSN|nr:hypothetical protein TEA_009067 [Camellia sinensis var. sinensis]